MRSYLGQTPASKCRQLQMGSDAFRNGSRWTVRGVCVDFVDFVPLGWSGGIDNARFWIFVLGSHTVLSAIGLALVSRASGVKQGRRASRGLASLHHT